MTDPRTPVVVGVGQSEQRVGPEEARDPLDLLAEAVDRAVADAAATRPLLARADTVAVVEIVSWRYPDAAAALARRLGISPRRTVGTTTGGNSPQLLLNELGRRIASGDADVAVVGGAECIHTRWRARREPRVELTWAREPDPPCPDVLGDDRPGASEYEEAHGARAPTLVYPLFETAVRGAAGRGIEEHQRATAELWASFAAVAADNPHAWSRRAWTADEIRTPGPGNRTVCFPYPKRMCANIDVDQGAALLVCSYEAARAAGVADDRLVFLHAGADAHDHWFPTERASLAAAPAIGAVVKGALGAAGVGLDDVARFDLYSCFPSAVQLALAAIGLAGPTGGDPRPVTVTGGLGFAGGPVNDYVTHAVARMVEACRADPGSIGVTTGLGWYATKHSCGVWSSHPPAAGFRRVDPEGTQAVVDALPRRRPAGVLATTITVEATSVPFDREGRPTSLIVAGLTDRGDRALAVSHDPDVAATVTTEPWEGRRVRIRPEGEVNLVET